MVVKIDYTYLLFITVLLTVGACSQNLEDKVNIPAQQKDEISLLVEQVKNTATAAEKKTLLNQAYNLTKALQNDSLKAKYLVQLSYQYTETDDTTRFRKINKEAIILTTQLQNLQGMAEVYWDLGSYFSDRVYRKDSAYYCYAEAQQLYKRLNKNFPSARMLLNMAIMQTDIKDYIGSEATTKKAIELLRPLKKYKQLHSCYNNLGIISDALGNYNEAIDAYEQAFFYLKKTDQRNALEPQNLNNIGVVHKNQGNYREAINSYTKAKQKNELYAKNPLWNATFIDNIAYAQFKNGDTAGVLEKFYTALAIRDSLNYGPGIAINKLHLAEYYATHKDTLQAVKNAKEARDLAASSKNYKYLLQALEQLSELEKGEKSAAHLKAYLKISDSLQTAERRFKDNIARVRLKTDDLRIENAKISRQIGIIVWVAFAIISFILLLFVIFWQRFKNRELVLEKEKQEADAEITRLMLVQKTKMEEGSFRERKRISEELHDGVLGRLFGTRISMGSINEIEDRDEAAAKLEDSIDELQNIEQEIRSISHKLNNASFIAKTKYMTLIKELLDLQSKSGAFRYVLKNDDAIAWKEVPDNIKFNLYRVIQESTQNIIKHSKATKVSVTFKKEAAAHILTIIQDNGVGFDATGDKAGIGMKTMRSRITNLSGKMTLDSVEGEGTTIYISVPAFQNSLQNKLKQRLSPLTRFFKKFRPSKKEPEMPIENSAPDSDT